jgi:hypothetical protein
MVQHILEVKRAAFFIMQLASDQTVGNGKECVVL